MGGRLGGVEHAEPPAGACADVEEAASGAETFRNAVHCRGDLREHLLHGQGDLPVLLIEDPQHLQRRARVEIDRSRVDAFRGEGAKVEVLGHGGTRYATLPNKLSRMKPLVYRAILACLFALTALSAAQTWRVRLEEPTGIEPRENEASPRPWLRSEAARKAFA